MIHDHDVAKIDDSNNRKIEALPLNLQTRRDPFVFAGPSKGATAHKNEPLAHKFFEKRPIVPPHGVLQAFCFTNRIER